MNDTTTNSRRLRRYAIREQSLVAIFNGRVCIRGTELPPDATVEHVNYDYASMSVSVIVRSESFPPVPFGEEIPYRSEIRLERCGEADVHRGTEASWRDREPLC